MNGRQLKDLPLKQHIVLAFWDAEERESDGHPKHGPWGHAMPLRIRRLLDRVALGINWTCGGCRFEAAPEKRSVESAPGATAHLWNLGRLLAPEVFTEGLPVEVTDDHVPWIEAGCPISTWWACLPSLAYDPRYASQLQQCKPERRRQGGFEFYHAAQVAI